MSEENLQSEADTWAKLAPLRMASAATRISLMERMSPRCWLCQKNLAWKDDCFRCRVFQLEDPRLHTKKVQTIINALQTLRSCHKLVHR
jgi:hypothetical protein